MLSTMPTALIAARTAQSIIADVLLSTPLFR